MYSIKSKSGKLNRAKGVKRSAVKRFKFADYYKMLFQDTEMFSMFEVIRSVNHSLQTVVMNKKSLSSGDDKRHSLSNRVDTLAYGHYALDPLCIHAHDGDLLIYYRYA